jgi:hypothetical protein
VLSTAFSVHLVFRTYHEALLWDQWDSVPFFERLRLGTATFGDFIRQHNEHRILIPRLVFALDLWLTDARNGVNIAAILLCQAVHALVFWRLIALSVSDRLLRVMLAAFVMLLLFSIVQQENFYWGFQIQFVGVFLFVTVAAYARSAAQLAGPGKAPLRIAVGLLFGAGAALMMSNGVAALFCLALVFACARLFNRLTLALALIGLGLIVIYAATFTPNPGHTPLGFAPRHPLVFLRYVAVYLGCVFAPLGLPVALLAGALGLALTGLAALGLFTGRLERNRVNLTLVSIMSFVGLTAAMTGIGRSSFGLMQAASSRYATPSAVFWAATVTLVVAWLLADRNRREARAMRLLWLTSGVTMLAILSTALVQREFHYKSRIRAADMSRASNAILSAVHDDSALRVLFPDVALMKNLWIPILKERRFNMFARQPWPLGSEVPESRLITDAARCIGAVDGVTPVADGADAFQLVGWAWDGDGRPFEHLVVLSPERRVIGFGSSGYPRPDVRRHHRQVSSFWTGWLAFARAPGGRLGVYGLRRDGSLCRIGN